MFLLHAECLTFRFITRETVVGLVEWVSDYGGFEVLKQVRLLVDLILAAQLGTVDAPARLSAHLKHGIFLLLSMSVAIGETLKIHPPKALLEVENILLLATVVDLMVQIELVKVTESMLLVLLLVQFPIMRAVWGVRGPGSVEVSLIISLRSIVAFLINFLQIKVVDRDRLLSWLRIMSVIVSWHIGDSDVVMMVIGHSRFVIEDMSFFGCLQIHSWNPVDH